MVPMEETAQWAFKTTSIQASALLGTCLLFLVEFTFDTTQWIHLAALCLMAMAVPLFVPIVISMHYWHVDVFEKSDRDIGVLMKFATIASVMAVLAIGLAIFSISSWAGLAYGLGIVLACYCQLSFMNRCPTISEPKKIN